MKCPAPIIIILNIGKLPHSLPKRKLSNRPQLMSTTSSAFPKIGSSPDLLSIQRICTFLETYEPIHFRRTLVVFIKIPTVNQDLVFCLVSSYISPNLAVRRRNYIQGPMLQRSKSTSSLAGVAAERRPKTALLVDVPLQSPGCPTPQTSPHEHYDSSSPLGPPPRP